MGSGDGLTGITSLRRLNLVVGILNGTRNMRIDEGFLPSCVGKRINLFLAKHSIHKSC